MDDVRYDFKSVTRLEAEALGQPGQRTFRLIAASDRGETAVLWIEKEQLQALGEAIDRLLAQVGPRRTRRLDAGPQPPRPVAALLDPPTVEFKIGQLGLGYDVEENRCLLIAHDIEELSEGSSPVLRCLISQGQFRHLSEQIASIMASGRPLCPMCGLPLSDSPHFCPPSNGHLKRAEALE